jgi:hypothetical protein
MASLKLKTSFDLTKVLNKEFSKKLNKSEPDFFANLEKNLVTWNWRNLELKKKFFKIVLFW